MSVVRAPLLFAVAAMMPFHVAATSFSASRAAGGPLLSKIGAHDPGLASSVREIYRTEQPVFIFVPGILGSKLVTPQGRTVWGAIDFDKHALQYPSNVTPAFLDSFSVYGYRNDVYGRFRNIVEGLDISDVSHFLVFPYDWREDLRRTASRFDTQLRTTWAPTLKGRRIVIVAHSMGGLMVEWWYKQKYTKQQQSPYPFHDIMKVVFLGTPHHGAPSALLSIITGYQPPNPGRFEQAVYAKMFRDLNDAAITFPSLFEMFPLGNIVFEDTPTGKTRVDHFSLTAWRRYGWGGAPANLNDRFYVGLKQRLESGQQFQSVVQAQPCIPNAVYFYSKSYPTATSISIHRRNGKFLVETAYPERSGDGRVPIESAENEGCVTDALQIRPDREEHGALANDDTFIDFLVTIRDVAMRTADARVAKLIGGNSEAVSLMAEAKVLLPVPVTADARHDPDSQAILDLNRRILSLASGGDPAAAVYRAARDAASPSEAAHLYAIALGFDDHSQLAFHAANNLGLVLLNGGAPAAAKGNLELSVSNEPIAENDAERRRLLAAAQNNLAVALYRLGERSSAGAAWQKAVVLDSKSPAHDHLERLLSAHQ